MLIKTLVVGQLHANCYLYFNQQTFDTFIIDPGDDAQYLIQTINRFQLKPRKILLTHGHFDHVLAATELRLTYSIPLLIHKDDLFLYQRAASSAQHFTHTKADTVFPPDNYFIHGDKISLPGNYLLVIHTPGHTPGSVCFYDRQEKRLFTGDTLFKDGVGRSDFSYSSLPDLYRSLNRLAELPPKIKMYPGHGDSASLIPTLRQFV